MPEFAICFGSDNAYRTYRKADSFTQGYIEALFFTDASDQDDECHDLTLHDIAAETWKRIEKDCLAFRTQAASLLALAYDREDYSPEQAGRDFWFTRNGHGVGFWDRKHLEDDSAEYKALTAEMIANRDNNAAWDAACRKRSALKSESLGEKLSAVARKYRNVDVYKGDDGHLYLS